MLGNNIPLFIYFSIIFSVNKHLGLCTLLFFLMSRFCFAGPDQCLSGFTDMSNLLKQSIIEADPHKFCTLGI